MNKPELLLPAGSKEILYTAFDYGADAVYIGGEMYGLRAGAKNFSDEDMIECFEYAHSLGKKVYVTANITAHNEDLEGIKAYFAGFQAQPKNRRPDAFIISDPGVFMLARENAPDIDVHISTQANNVNYLTYNFWHKQGATRVVSARELSLTEIAQIRENIPEDMEIESFMQGAMCISYSGRCLLSNYFTGRDANKGACTHSCRWKYKVYIEEETRPGEILPVEENERGTYIFNSKDLCMIEHVPELIKAGINSFKVEGRMKTALYVASMARAYRRAIDDYYVSPELFEKNKASYLEEIYKCTYRPYSTGFYFGKPDHDSQIYDSNTYKCEAVYIGYPVSVDENGYALIMQRNKFSVGDKIEILKKDGSTIETQVLDMINDQGEHIENCPHPQKMINVKFSDIPEVRDILRVPANIEG